MRPWSPSRTAQSTAFLRAAHLRLDDIPPVFADTAAERLLPRLQRQALRRLERLSQPWARPLRASNDPFVAMRSHIVVRARYAEDALKEGADAGAGRLVVLGAGLDSFALRDTGPDVEVLEIDHPATQRWKQQRIEKSGLSLVRETQFLPVDFEHTTLSDAWPRRDAPDVISWLGVTYYLRKTAIAASMADLAHSTAPGSRLVLDFWDRPSAFDPSRTLLEGTRISVGLLSEPMRSFLSEQDIRDLAAETGWQVREILSPKAQNARYLSGRSDGLDVPNFAWVAELER